MNRLSFGRTRPLWVVAACLLLALLVAACAAPAAESPAAESPAADTTAADAATTPQAEAAPAGETYNGLPVGFTPEGWPFKGNPAAPVTLIEYSDFQCPFCARFFINTEPGIVENYIQTGQVRMIFRDLPLKELHPNAPAAHEAAACVAEQGAPLFWAMYDALFQAQDEWAESAEPQPVFVRLAQEAGADADAMSACIEGGARQAAVETSVNDALALGLDGTPSFRIVNEASGDAYTLVGAQPYARFAEALDAVLAGNAPPAAAAPPQQTVPAWATAEGLAPDSANPGYTVAGDQTRGDPNAPVVVVEFSDFQCPYCKRHLDQTQPELDRLFVDTGEVRWVYKHYPLPIHPQAPAAGVAAECAAVQGQYMEMHSALFTQVDAWSINDPTPVFTQIAADLGLDADAFAACLVDPAIAARVDADMADGGPFVQGTPTFVILANGQGRIIPGALPLPSFQAELQKAVDGVGG